MSKLRQKGLDNLQNSLSNFASVLGVSDNSLAPKKSVDALAVFLQVGQDILGDGTDPAASTPAVVSLTPAQQEIAVYCLNQIMSLSYEVKSFAIIANTAALPSNTVDPETKSITDSIVDQIKGL